MNDSNTDPWFVALMKRLSVPVILLLIALVLMLIGLSNSFQLWELSIEVAKTWSRAAIVAIAACLVAVSLGMLIREWWLGPRQASDHSDQPPEFLHTLHDVESFGEAFADCERIDLLLRTGANVLHRYRKALLSAARSGTIVRIIILDPSSEAARTVYGPGSDQYLHNARLLPGAIRELEKNAKKRVIVRKTIYLPPFSMFIAYKRDKVVTYARAQINFTHSAVGDDRPTIRIDSSSKWFRVFEEEFKEAWKAADRTTYKNLSRILDDMSRLIHPIVRMDKLFQPHDQELARACPFESESTSRVAFYETASTMAIPNIAPIVDGHCLVIPKRHVERLGELTANEVTDVFETARQVSAKLMAALGATGMNWAVQDGSVAGQTVPHFHVHIVPRRQGDLEAPGDWFGELPRGAAVARAVDHPDRPRLAEAEMLRDAEKLRSIMATDGDHDEPSS